MSDGAAKMSTGRLKVAIIAGLAPRGWFKLFEAWSDFCDADIFMFDQQQTLGSEKGLNNQVFLYPFIEDKAGYMEGLEARLQGYDLVVAIETTQLSSFQAIRGAKKYHIPSLVYVSEYQPFFYQNYKNIQAIKYDILQNSQQVWVTSSLAKSMLMIEGGISDEKIKLVRPPLTATAPDKRAQQRQKFRKHLNIGNHETLFLFHRPLQSYTHPEIVLSAFRFACSNRLLDRETTKILFCGTGPLSNELKHQAYNMGFGQQVLFLHQNPQPFIGDLLAAADASICLQQHQNDELEVFPWDFLRSLEYALPPISVRGSIFQELACDQIIGLPALAAEYLALAMSDIVSAKSETTELKLKLSMELPKQMSKENFLNLSKSLFMELQAGNQSASSSQQIKSHLNDIENLVEESQLESAMVKIEESLLSLDLNDKFKSAFLRLKGDILDRQGNFENAVSAYSDSLQYWQENHLSYRGLGVVCCKSLANEEALIYFRKVLALAGDDSESMLGLGVVYQRVGLLDEAAHWLEKSLLFKDTAQRSMISLSRLSKEFSDKRRGIKTLEKVIDLFGENSSLLLNLGELLIDIGELEKGAAMVNKALSPSYTVAV